jgi:hypothetical protein
MSSLSLLTQQTIQNFLFEHENEDEKAFVLKQKEIHGVPSSVIATQLIGRRKAKTKLPTWYKTKGIIYPATINLEQCSSEATAIFKRDLIHSLISQTVLAADITGGFGVDTYFLSSIFDSFHYIEPYADLVEIANHNHHQLGASRITHQNLSGEVFIKATPLEFDLIYIDPSRRDEKSRKIYRLSDCIPDINTLQHDLFQKCRFLLVKAAPLLDIQQGLREIQQVKRVTVVSVNNECKELLFFAEKSYQEEPLIEAVDLFDTGKIRSSFRFTLAEEKKAQAKTGEPEGFLYEPNAPILKAGAFKLIAEKLGLIKLSSNTHLYTSSKHVTDFPGKVFKIEYLNPDIKHLNKMLPDKQVNVISRNYPLTPEEIKKKLRLRDGGEKFLIAFSSTSRKHLALCEKIRGT